MICICPNCGTTAAPRTYTRGSIFIEIILWLCFIIPGIVYTIWRLTTRQKVCRVCRQPGVVPIASPRGRELTRAYGQQDEREPPSSDPVSYGRLAANLFTKRPPWL